MKAERWMPVDGHIGYEVSDRGNVRSMPRVVVDKNGVSKKLRGKTLSIQDDKDGYRVVGICNDGKLWLRKVHRLVATAFHEKEDDCTEVNHINGIKSDNRVSNLEWCTSSHNKRHAYAEGLWTPPIGEKNGQSKLTEKDVCEIRSRIASGEIHRSIAADFGVGRQMIGMISTRRNWTHVSECSEASK